MLPSIGEAGDRRRERVLPSIGEAGDCGRGRVLLPGLQGPCGEVLGLRCGHVPNRGVEVSKLVHDRRFVEGVALYGASRYWHAHEAWEALWRRGRRHAPAAVAGAHPGGGGAAPPSRRGATPRRACGCWRARERSSTGCPRSWAGSTCGPARGVERCAGKVARGLRSERCAAGLRPWYRSAPRGADGTRRTTHGPRDDWHQRHRGVRVIGGRYEVRRAIGRGGMGVVYGPRTPGRAGGWR
ncbi:MAG: DUF309 domain-containing protein [Deltaproteobacteria bacterium]|nr:DUF309 domain-containing protein [Deltaproteobacteria bacterium]